MGKTNLVKNLLKAEYLEETRDRAKDAADGLADHMAAVDGAVVDAISLIDRVGDYLDLFVFFNELDYMLSRLKFVFAEFERSHFAWARLLVPPPEDPEKDLEEFYNDEQNDYPEGNDIEGYPEDHAAGEDPVWLENMERVLNKFKRILMKRDENDNFWYFYDPFLDDYYLQSSVSGNVAEIYGDLIEIRGYIEKLEKGWDPVVYDHFQDLIEYHTTHHIVLLLRAVQSLIGKAV